MICYCVYAILKMKTMPRFSQTLLRLSGWDLNLFWIEGKVRSIPKAIARWVGSRDVTTPWIENFAENLL